MYKTHRNQHFKQVMHGQQNNQNICWPHMLALFHPEQAPFLLLLCIYLSLLPCPRAPSSLYIFSLLSWICYFILPDDMIWYLNLSFHNSNFDFCYIKFVLFLDVIGFHFLILSTYFICSEFSTFWVIRFKILFAYCSIFLPIGHLLHLK